MHSFLNFAQKRRYSAKNNIRPIAFMCIAPQAKQVCIMGDFNQWDPQAHPMQWYPDAAWRLTVPLTHGHHKYVFVVDGQLTLDPRAHGISRNERDERVSMIAVS